jgi:hypothetical protein
LLQLGHQTYSNLTVFVLDDSATQRSRKAVDCSGYNVIRRPSRAGYKAGNVNNWLRIHGHDFAYFVIADADSRLPPRFVADMVHFAEHPHNARVAIFESVIQAWNGNTRFSRLLNVDSPLSGQVRLAWSQRLGSVLSVGHNNLYRTTALLDIGGFDESFVAEDFATTVHLLHRRGDLCRMTPVVSYERVPSNLREFLKRRRRWAAQTMQLLDLDISGVPWHVSGYLVMAAFDYIASPISLIVLVWLLAEALDVHRHFSGSGVAPWTVPVAETATALGFWCVYVGTPLALRVAILLRRRVPVKDALLSAWLIGTLVMASMASISWSVIRVLAGGDVRFVATGRSAKPTFVGICRIAAVPCLLVVALGLTLPWSVQYAWVAGVWLGPAALIPITVWLAQK